MSLQGYLSRPNQTAAQFERKTLLLLWATDSDLGSAKVSPPASGAPTGPVWLQGYSNYHHVTGVWSSCMSSHAAGEFLGCRPLGKKNKGERLAQGGSVWL